MNAQLLICTGGRRTSNADPNTEGTLWLGLSNNPNSFVPVYNTASSKFYYCEISPYNPNDMIGFGTSVVYSTDGGTTWNVPAGTQPSCGELNYDGSFENVPRSIRYVSENVVLALSTTKMWRSTDKGATWTDISATLAALAPLDPAAYAMDVDFVDDGSGVGFLLKEGEATIGVSGPSNPGGWYYSDPIVYRTGDGGLNWSQAGLPLPHIGQAGGLNTYSRILADSEDWFYVVRDKGSLGGEVQGFENSGGSYNVTNFWVLDPPVVTLELAYGRRAEGTDFASLPSPGTDVLWLPVHDSFKRVNGGFLVGTRYGGRYAIDETLPLGSNIPYGGDLGNTWAVYEGTEAAETSEPIRMAMWGLDLENTWCLNWRNSLYKWKYLPTPQNITLTKQWTQLMSPPGSDHLRLTNISGRSVAAFPPGCTDPDACNYDEGAAVDDQSCSHVHTLIDCQGNEDDLAGNNALLPLYAARPGYVIIDVSSLLSGTSVQSFASFFNGTPFLSLGMNILDGQPPQDRVDQYIGQVIHGINNNPGSGTAYRLPSSLNTLNPGSGNGILWVLPVGYAGQTVSITGAAVSLTHESIVGGPTPPGVLKLVEYPGVCWTVGDPDPDSCPGTAVTITNAYEDCFRCIPIQPNLICQDCDSMMQITNPGESPQQLFSSGSCRTCVNAGDILTGTFLVGFPEPNQAQLQPLEAGQTCSAASNCPVTLTFSGDYSDILLAGSVFTVDNSGNEYTVASVDYDSGTDVTTIVTEENCQGETFDYVNPNTGCNCQGIVTVRDKNGDVVTQEVYDCVDGYVDEEWTWTVPAGGDYDITFEAEYCGDSRTCTWLVRSCAEYSVSETDCHEFTFSLGREPLAGVNHTMLVEDLSTGAVTSIDLKETAFPYTWTSPGDGVYLITLSNEQTNESSIFEVVDTCDIKECRDTLVRDLLCSCEDPCADDDCSTEDQKEKLRYQLIRIGMLWDRLYEEANLYRQRYLGLHTYGSTRRADLEMIRLLIERIRTVSGNCAQCSS